MPGATGRKIPDNSENILWTQRILKEEAVNGRVGERRFSIRAVVSVADVPAKFKPMQMDPREAARAQGFDPEALGWDPNGPEAREFKQSCGNQRAGPRMRHDLPVTSNQEFGWLLSPPGNMADRVDRGRVRLGFGWPEGPPTSFSEVSAAPLDNRASSQLSAVRPTESSLVAPTELVRASDKEPGRGHRRSDERSVSRNELARAGASQVSGADPGLPAQSQLSHANSLPSLGTSGTADPVKLLSRREASVERAMQESGSYLNNGAHGRRWTRYLNGTDVTDFHNEFTKRNLGVPLYKVAR